MEVAMFFLIVFSVVGTYILIGFFMDYLHSIYCQLKNTSRSEEQCVANVLGWPFVLVYWLGASIFIGIKKLIKITIHGYLPAVAKVDLSYSVSSLPSKGNMTHDLVNFICSLNFGKGVSCYNDDQVLNFLKLSGYKNIDEHVWTKLTINKNIMNKFEAETTIYKSLK